MSSYVLSEIAEVVDCEHKTAPTVEDSQYHSIRTTDIANGKIHIDKANRVSEDTYLKWSRRAIPEPGDIILAREAPVGEVGWIAEGYKVCLGQRTVLLKVTHNGVSKKFLLYYLVNPDTRYNLQARATGSVVAHLNVKDIRGFSVSLPSLSEQKAIASVLSSLDDKIDLLHRQNKTLEAMAETLFRQWFVEEAEIQSENQLTLGELIESVSITHRLQTDTIIFLNTSDIYKGDILNNSQVNVNSLPGQAKKSIQRNDILFSEIRPANGRWAYIHFDAEDYVVSTKLMVLRSKGFLSQAFVYFFLTNSQTIDWLQLLAESRSGTFPQITFDQLKDLKINIPSKSILSNSIEWCESALKKINSNLTQIRTLETLRDTLLPKLMSGEVRVAV
ncbi:MAG: restriction endonuclease subunit S [Nitrosomonas sp.]|nr:restriction endonuclease subunit S [Nitrosomonas sp.]